MNIEQRLRRLEEAIGDDEDFKNTLELIKNKDYNVLPSMRAKEVERFQILKDKEIVYLKLLNKVLDLPIVKKLEALGFYESSSNLQKGYRELQFSIGEYGRHIRPYKIYIISATTGNISKGNGSSKSVIKRIKNSELDSVEDYKAAFEFIYRLERKQQQWITQ